MDILYLLVPLSVFAMLGILGVFAWALQGGQFDDLEGVAAEILEAGDRLNTASTTDYNVVRKEQPTLQTLEVVTTRQQGGCFCTGGSIQNDMRSATGPCSCAR